MLKKIKIITLILLSFTFAAALPSHAPGEEVCDGHAFTNYNKYLALQNINSLLAKDVNNVHVGSSKPTYRVIQFCNFESSNCLKSFKTLQELANQQKNLEVTMLYYSETKSNFAENIYRASTIAYLAKGESSYNSFISQATSKPIKTGADIQNILDSLDITNDQIKKYEDESQRLLTESKKLATELKLKHAPSILIMTSTPNSDKDIYFSQHEDVPSYIVNRAIKKYLHKENK